MTGDRFHRRTVVVVDENTEYREILIDLLARIPGLRVAASGVDGTEDVELCARHRPDFLLLDSGLADFASIRAAAAVREITPHTVIVLLTTGDAWQLDSDAGFALSEGFASADRVVLKSDIKSVLLGMLAHDRGEHSGPEL
jgi:DNA-binding NarL/FixJ family response regulator